MPVWILEAFVYLLHKRVWFKLVDQQGTALQGCIPNYWLAVCKFFNQFDYKGRVKYWCPDLVAT